MEPIYSEWNPERTVGTAAAQAMLDTEIPLPAGRAAQRILHVEGEAENHVAHCAAGCVTAEGTVSLQLLIEPPDGSRPYGLRTSAGYRQDIPVPGAAEGMRGSVIPELQELRCRVENGRVMLSGVLELAAEVFENAHLRVMTGVSGAEGVQLRRGILASAREIPLGSATVHLRGELPGMAQVLLQSGAAEIKGIEPTEGGLSVSGSLAVSVLAAEDNGQMNQITENLSFEELIPIGAEMPHDMAGLDAVAALRDLTVTPVDENGTGLDVEALLELRATGIRREEMEAVTDAYALKGGLDCVQERVECREPGPAARKKCSVRETVAVPPEAPDAYRAVYAAARPVVTGVSDADGLLGVDGVLFLSVVFQTDAGGVFGFEEELPFQCRLDAPYVPGAMVRARALHARVSGSGRMLDVMVTMEAEARREALSETIVATGLEAAEAPALPTGVLIYLAGEGECCWDVGKRFGVSPADVADWNPSVTEPFVEGQQLVLLRGPRK